MKMMLSIIILLFLVLNSLYSFAVTNHSWWELENEIQGFTQTTDSIGGTFYSFCENISNRGMTNKSIINSISINWSTGFIQNPTSETTFKGIQFCEASDTGQAGACQCKTATVINISFGQGIHRDFTLTPINSDEISRHFLSNITNLSYSLDNTKDYWVRWIAKNDFGTWNTATSGNHCQANQIGEQILENDNWSNFANPSCVSQGHGIYNIIIHDYINLQNQSPSLIINTPLNNSRTHNATISPYLNFTISTTSPNLNFTFEVYIDKNSTLITRINRSENFTSGNFTITYTISSELLGSVNGTHFIKINGTDNASNYFEALHSFNLTNNISNYNATNVTITPLLLEANNDAKGHCNLTTHIQEFNNLTSNWTAWWINGSVVSWNVTTLDASNVTLDSNITYMCAVKNGFGDTSLTPFVNSSTITIGDTTAPVIRDKLIPKTSFTTDENVNISMNCTDANQISLTRVTTNRTNTHTNNTMTLLGNGIYQFVDNFAVGDYNIPYFYCGDGSNNVVQEPSNLSFSVTSPAGGGGSTPSGGGGGGGLPSLPPCKDNELLIGGICVNSTLFNVTLKIIGLTNIQPIIFYRACGGFQEWRQLLKSNKILKSAEFDKPQLNVNVTVKGSDALIVKKLKSMRISERIDMGNLKLTDTTQQVARVLITLRIISLCNPITYLFIAVPITIFIFRKRLSRLFKKR